jgi:hypothetical protein
MRQDSMRKCTAKSSLEMGRLIRTRT